MSPEEGERERAPDVNQDDRVLVRAAFALDVGDVSLPPDERLRRGRGPQGNGRAERPFRRSRSGSASAPA